MNEDWLESMDQKYDLGVIIRSNLLNLYFLEARNRANKMLGIIIHNDIHKRKEIIGKL